MCDENTNLPAQEDLNEVMRVRREKLDKLRESGFDPFKLTTAERTHSSERIISGFEALEGSTAVIAGRLMSKRVMGKASFAHVMDREGTLQIYVKRDDVGQEVYGAFKAMDIGDIVSVSGTVFRTKSGEISLHVTGMTLLSKSLRPLPEKFHGLKDPDLRYRQRYTDLIVNPEVRRTFEISNKIYLLTRQYLNALNFMEVQTPILHTLSSSAAARPFVTKHNTLDIPMYLRIEMETYLKRLIVGGLERVYEIGRIFRNEGMSVKHNPEFTMLELYEAYTDYYGMMERVEGLFSYIALQLNGTTKVTYQGVELDFAPPWKRVTMAEAVREVCGVDFDAIESDSDARAAAKNAGVHVEDKFTKGQTLFAMFDELVEPTLVQPTFVTEYPIEISPFAKRVPGKPMFTERFEFFIYGREGGNAFSELNDPIDQLERFIVQYNTRMAGDGDAQVDYDYVNALEIGLPPTGGVGIGMDRLVMLFTDSYSIRDVLLFPTMRPRGDG